MVKWSELDPGQIKAFCDDQFSRWQEYPSLRDIFYAFVDDLWPNTVPAYQGVSRWLRDKRLSGELDWRIIRDGSGRELSFGDHLLTNPQDYAQSQLTLLSQSPDYFHLPRWLHQPNKVIVVSEKEADCPVVKSILSDLNVDVAFQRGYTGWRLLFQLANILHQDGAKNSRIIALGDFDPSGENIVSFLSLALRVHLDCQNLLVEKVMVTKQQIEDLKLPHRPEDKKEIRKLQKDPRFKSWPYGLYRVETAAIKARYPDYFEDTLRQAVLKYFDQSIYEPVQAEETEQRSAVDSIIQDWFDRADLERE